MSLIDTLISMYVTLLPAIIAGVVNSIFCKSGLLPSLKKPIDFNKNFIDGKRILGDNKTWKGLFGYIILTIFFQILWGLLCAKTSLLNYNLFYNSNENSAVFNIIVGFLVGLFYALFELPNSFLKRRLSIEPGKPPKGAKKIYFIILDQADSVFGVRLVVAMFYRMTVGFYFTYVFVGLITHLFFNMLLYFIGMRKNMF